MCFFMGKNFVDDMINRVRGVQRVDQLIADQAYKVWAPKPGYKEAAVVVGEFTNGNLTEEAKSAYLKATGQEFWIRVNGQLKVINSKGLENVELGKRLYNEGGSIGSPEIDEIEITRKERYG